MHQSRPKGRRMRMSKEAKGQRRAGLFYALSFKLSPLHPAKPYHYRHAHYSARLPDFCNNRGMTAKLLLLLAASLRDLPAGAEPRDASCPSVERKVIRGLAAEPERRARKPPAA